MDRWVDNERGAMWSKKADERSDKEVDRIKEKAHESVNGQVGGAELHSVLKCTLSLLWGGEGELNLGLT
jgi:hypothetical protein